MLEKESQASKKKIFFKDLMPQEDSFQYSTENMQLQYALSGLHRFVVTK